jgi:hypothetical protein
MRVIQQFHNAHLSINHLERLGVEFALADNFNGNLTEQQHRIVSHTLIGNVKTQLDHFGEMYFEKFVHDGARSGAHVLALL